MTRPPLGVVAELLENLGLGVATATTVETWFVLVVTFVAVYVIGRLIIFALVERALNRRGLDDHSRRPILLITRVVTVFLALSIAFGAAGFGSFLVAMAGVGAAATLAIGFALQNVIANFVAGVFIYTDKPFRIGDWIEWEGYSGVVEDISFRVTRVRTFDNELLTVPNASLTDGVLKNPVAGERLRIKVGFGIGYDDDIERATAIISEAAADHSDILEEPAPSVRVTELADSSVVLQSRIWIADPARSDFVRIRSEYVQDVKRRFDEAGINIPYPVRTLEGAVTVSDSV